MRYYTRPTRPTINLCEEAKKILAAGTACCCIALVICSRETS
ncbi:MAG: hypothetical protein GQF41_0718 [Candidatus Rifleibacterium amylolyticum]|nr:MAG: hypothetical protein GQF41_0718 [Candidatus Rifleibacterium amylolyticum]